MQTSEDSLGQLNIDPDLKLFQWYQHSDDFTEAAKVAFSMCLHKSNFHAFEPNEEQQLMENKIGSLVSASLYACFRDLVEEYCDPGKEIDLVTGQPMHVTMHSMISEAAWSTFQSNRNLMLDAIAQRGFETDNTSPKETTDYANGEIVAVAPVDVEPDSTTTATATSIAEANDSEDECDICPAIMERTVLPYTTAIIPARTHGLAKWLKNLRPPCFGHFHMHARRTNFPDTLENFMELTETHSLG